MLRYFGLCQFFHTCQWYDIPEWATHQRVSSAGVHTTVFIENEVLHNPHWKFKPGPPISGMWGQQYSKMTSHPVQWKYLDGNRYAN